ncbi:hypothetical protein ASPCAL04019 [Aspergillus calidoustus]|uniref:C3H1-type domain-containing protein n=1 Tax=Aspergillus calidoustus TaxID=454130 RepID=A0A0U5FXJ1_ASPCI|nr:hypothetical protein ASPCAL04019 [Aspergillus calidoustus]
MTVCSFFQQGRCKYGNRCKFEHPGQQQQTFQGGNRFGALSGGGGGFNNRGQNQQQSQNQANYGVTATDIKADLQAGKGRPDWVFSCYGPGRNAPRQLFGGPQRELSFEELRLRHYEAAAVGNPGPAIQEAETLYNEAVNQMEVVLKNLDDAVKYITDGAKEHPNRIDITNGQAAPSNATAPAFSQKTPAFGAPGFALQAPPQPSFGQPAFGQPSLGGASGFGQPSALGAAAPAFGQQPAFGQPSFGKPSFGQSAFGQPSMGASPFVQAAGTASSFSQIPNQTQAPTSGFGQPSPFAQAGSGFGQSAVTSTTTSGFGTPALAGSNPFGQPPSMLSSNPPPFPAGAEPPTLPPFPNLSGGFPSAPSGFGQQQQSQPQPQQQQPQAAAISSTPAVASSGALGPGPAALLRIENPSDLNPIPPLNGQTVRDNMSKRILRWKGQPVKYIDDAPCYLHPQDQKTAVRIFFPDGPPDKATLRDAQAKPEEYTPEVTEQYEFFLKNGYFKDGIIPRVPPKTEWVSFDF